MAKRAKHAAIILVALLAVTIVVVFATQYKPPLQNINGLNAEAGIIKSDGTVIPLRVGQTVLSTVTINNVLLGLNDYIYWRHWLILRSSGDIIDPRLTTVRFKLWQTLNGPSDWTAGTEAPSTGRPLTDPSASWFQVALPVNTEVIVPITYIDNWWGDGAETPSTLLPYTVVVNNAPIRQARVEKAGSFANWAAGTYIWTVYCDVISVTWAYSVLGQQGVQTKPFQPSPWRISYTFTIVVGAEGSLSVTLSGESSSSAGAPSPIPTPTPAAPTPTPAAGYTLTILATSQYAGGYDVWYTIDGANYFGSERPWSLPSGLHTIVMPNSIYSLTFKYWDDDHSLTSPTRTINLDRNLYLIAIYG